MPRRNLKAEELQAQVDELLQERDELMSMLSTAMRPTIMGAISVIAAQASMFSGNVYGKEQRAISDWLKVMRTNSKRLDEIIVNHVRN